MKVAFYTLDDDELVDLKDDHKIYVPDPGGQRRFSIGAYTKSGDENELLGMVQFKLGIYDDGECYAMMDYIYVNAEIRRQGVGTRLLDKANRVLKKSDIKTSIIDLYGSDKVLPEDEDAFLIFLKETGYIAVKSDKAGRTEHFVRFTDR